MMRLVLVHSERLFCECLRRGLESSGSVAEVAGIALNGSKAVEQVQLHKPDIVITGVSLPVLNGVEMTRRITAQCRETRIIAVAGKSDRKMVRRMLEAGARGFLMQSAGLDELISAVELVHSGKVYLDPEVASLVCQDYREGPVDDGDTTAILSSLTSREREVLQLIAEGYSTKEAAALLSVSTKTIETHRYRVMTKLNVRSVAQLTKIAINCGLTTV